MKADLTFDQSWSVNDMANLVLDFHSVNVNSVPQLTLPVAVVTDPDGDDGDLIYQGEPYGQAEFPAEAQDQATIDQVLGVGPTIDTMTGDPLPAPSSVTVSVENGTGADDQATDTASALSALGFHTVGVGDISPVGDVSETVVYYGSRARGRGRRRSRGPLDDRRRDPGLRPLPGDRRSPGHRGHRYPVLRQRAAATVAPRHDGDHGCVLGDAGGRGHGIVPGVLGCVRTAVADDRGPAAVGSPGVRTGRDRDPGRAQPRLGTAASTASWPAFVRHPGRGSG